MSGEEEAKGCHAWTKEKSFGSRALRTDKEKALLAEVCNRVRNVADQLAERAEKEICHTNVSNDYKVLYSKEEIQEQMP